ncbi:hypothetical protein QE152_g7400 [Popillia japonica]|uniref:Uncharacterized protein n=1 Tax=Popillia japonica TaxID=7064 RepID=A0AAW1MBH7_POPJA
MLKFNFNQSICSIGSSRVSGICFRLFLNLFARLDPVEFPVSASDYSYSILTNPNCANPTKHSRRYSRFRYCPNGSIRVDILDFVIVQMDALSGIFRIKLYLNDNSLISEQCMNQFESHVVSLFLSNDMICSFVRLSKACASMWEMLLFFKLISETGKPLKTPSRISCILLSCRRSKRSFVKLRKAPGSSDDTPLFSKIRSAKFGRSLTAPRYKTGTL